MQLDLIILFFTRKTLAVLCICISLINYHFEKSSGKSLTIEISRKTTQDVELNIFYRIQKIAFRWQFISVIAIRLYRFPCQSSIFFALDPVWRYRAQKGSKNVPSASTGPPCLAGARGPGTPPSRLSLSDVGIHVIAAANPRGPVFFADVLETLSRRPQGGPDLSYRSIVC